MVDTSYAYSLKGTKSPLFIFFVHFSSSFSDLSIYAVKDGSCVLSFKIPQHPAAPPTDTTEVKPSEVVWAWEGLFVHEAGEV